ncbi:MAG: hypothetical protein MUC93_07150 [Bacteroidales bacterium]|jgi:hypothetical protein|nr:hypothetical protein [Bacteroidales bacterium]
MDEEADRIASEHAEVITENLRYSSKKMELRWIVSWRENKCSLWGYEMDNDPNVVEKWIDVAAGFMEP